VTIYNKENKSTSKTITYVGDSILDKNPIFEFYDVFGVDIDNIKNIYDKIIIKDVDSTEEFIDFDIKDIEFSNKSEIYTY
jgi:hypothetical protein